MLQTIEATIDENGHVQLLEPVRLSEPLRALVTILPGESDTSKNALLSEAALEEDWNRPEENWAWSHPATDGIVLFPFPDFDLP